MVNETQEEVLEALEVEGEHLDPGQPEMSGVPGMVMQYIPPQDRGAWIPAWELKKDRWGDEYGIPTKLPRGQAGQLLTQRREDGGKRWTLHQPANVLGPGRFQCFIGDCRKRVRERAQLVAHIEAYHRAEAQVYAPLLEKLRQAVIQDNPRLTALVEELVATPDQAIEAVPQTHTNGEYACTQCDWTPKPDAKNPRFALVAHMRKHGGER
jgi:hypothetical protein